LTLFGVFNGVTNPSVWAAVGSYGSYASFGFVYGLGNASYNILALGLNYLVGYLNQKYGYRAILWVWVGTAVLLIVSNVFWIIFLALSAKRTRKEAKASFFS
jgi:hypothetical protein